MKGLRLRPGFVESPWSALDSVARERILQFAADVLRFNRSQNLVSRVEPEARVAELLEECVCAALEVAALGGAPWVDVGSGAGFPGLVLASVHPGQPIDLVERRRGRCDFLRREVRALGLTQARVVEGDARDTESLRAPYGLAFAKAVANPGEIEALCGPLLAPEGGLVLFQRPGWRLPAVSASSGWSISREWTGLRAEGGQVVRSGFLLSRRA